MAELIQKAINANNKNLLSKSIALDSKGIIKKYNILFLITKDYVENLVVNTEIGTFDKNSFQEATNSYNRLLQEWKIEKNKHNADEEKRHHDSIAQFQRDNKTLVYHKQSFNVEQPQKPKENQFVNYSKDRLTIDISGVQAFIPIIVDSLKEIPRKKINTFISQAKVVIDSDNEKYVTKEHLFTLRDSFEEKCQNKASEILKSKYKYIRDSKVSVENSVEYETSVYTITKVILSEKTKTKRDNKLSNKASFFFDQNDNIIHMKTFKSFWKHLGLYTMIILLLGVAGYYGWQYGEGLYAG